MGYSTDFFGSLSLSRPTTIVEKNYLDKLANTRRMQRDVNKLMAFYKGEHGNPFANDKNNPDEIYGFKGEYFVGAGGFAGQDSDGSVIDYNSASGEIGWEDYKGDWDLRNELQKTLNADKIKQPGLWLQWELNEDGTELAWNGSEKFYNYIEWLQYLIQHFFEPWGIKLNGEIEWVGEDSSDRGKIVVVDNNVEILDGVIGYEKRV
jgi:hypothetical protein